MHYSSRPNNATAEITNCHSSDDPESVSHIRVSLAPLDKSYVAGDIGVVLCLKQVTESSAGDGPMEIIIGLQNNGINLNYSMNHVFCYVTR